MTLFLIISLLLPININAADPKFDEEEKAIAVEDAKNLNKDKNNDDIEKENEADDKEEDKDSVTAIDKVNTDKKSLQVPTTVQQALPEVQEMQLPKTIVNIRTAWYAKEKRERIVVDLSGGQSPAVYRNRTSDTLSINIEASIAPQKCSQLAKLLQKTHFINSAQIISLDDEKEVLLQLLVKNHVKEQLLTLNNPARVVIDLFMGDKGVKEVKAAKSKKKV